MTAAAIILTPVFDAGVLRRMGNKKGVTMKDEPTADGPKMVLFPDGKMTAQETQLLSCPQDHSAEIKEASIGVVMSLLAVVLIVMAWKAL